MEQNMPDTINNQLRETGVIAKNEILLKAVDLYIAYNVVTQLRRQINITGLRLDENSKKLLKG
jgi:hypothetical protein